MQVRRGFWFDGVFVREGETEVIRDAGPKGHGIDTVADRVGTHRKLVSIALELRPSLLDAKRPVMARSISNRASMRRTTSMAIGEMMISFLPAALRRAFSSRSAMAKKGRRAGAQHAASWI